VFKITRAAEYAILLLISLEKNQGKLLSLNKIAKKKALPLKFLEKIASQLKKEGILSSKEGVGGGYYLNKPVEKITLFEILRAIEGKKGLVSCIHGDCALEKCCDHRKVWERLQKKISNEFKKIKLNDLV